MQFIFFKNNPDLTDIQLFLDKRNLPSLTKEQADYLESPLTLLELRNALIKIPNYKTPGPDGFSVVEFIKRF